jgi:hypothetical protein
MTNVATTALFILIIAVIYVGVLAVAATGWVVFFQQKRPYSFSLLSSLTGLALATVSVIIAATLLVYVRLTGITDFDPRFPFGTFSLGALFSLGAVPASLAGLWQRNPLRWYALGCSAGIFLFWLFSAAGR